MQTYEVHDGFLEQGLANQIWLAFRSFQFVGVNARSWEKVFRLTDGLGLVGPDWQIENPALRRDGPLEYPGPAVLHPFFHALRVRTR